MNPKYFGDSYDIVKRFFCKELAVMGYEIAVEPMFTGTWEEDAGQAFLLFIGGVVAHRTSKKKAVALFLDPDTGIHRKASRQHVSLEQVAEKASSNDLVFAFDQSFSRQHDPSDALQAKLSALHELGVNAMYYDSHARFLFVSTEARLIKLREHFTSLGLPATRFVERAAA